MPKTIILDVPDNFDFGKLVSLGAHVEGLQILKPNQRVEVLTAAPAAKITVRKRNGDGVPQAVMSHYTPRGEFPTRVAEKWVQDAGYNPKSASPALTALKKNGLIEQVSLSKFRFLRPLAQGEAVKRTA